MVFKKQSVLSGGQALKKRKEAATALSFHGSGYVIWQREGCQTKN